MQLSFIIFAKLPIFFNNKTPLVKTLISVFGKIFLATIKNLSISLFNNGSPPNKVNLSIITLEDNCFKSFSNSNPTSEASSLYLPYLKQYSTLSPLVKSFSILL